MHKIAYFLSHIIVLICIVLYDALNMSFNYLMRTVKVTSIYYLYSLFIAVKMSYEFILLLCNNLLASTTCQLGRGMFSSEEILNNGETFY